MFAKTIYTSESWNNKNMRIYHVFGPKKTKQMLCYDSNDQ